VISAYELIRTEVGRSANVGQAVARIDGVTEVAVVTVACGMDRAGDVDRHGRAETAGDREDPDGGGCYAPPDMPGRAPLSKEHLVRRTRVARAAPGRR
jgi:hypothetical protein